MESIRKHRRNRNFFCENRGECFNEVANTHDVAIETVKIKLITMRCDAMRYLLEFIENIVRRNAIILQRHPATARMLS